MHENKTTGQMMISDLRGLGLSEPEVWLTASSKKSPPSPLTVPHTLTPSDRITTSPLSVNSFQPWN